MNPSHRHKSSTESAAEALVADINQLMADAEEMLADSTSQHAEEKIELMRPAHARAYERGRYGSAKARIVDALKKTDATIRANPYESLLVALGFGVVAGAVYFGRRR